MGTPSTQEITQMLVAWKQGDAEALEELTPLVHRELHRLAKHYMAGERGTRVANHALVNEAYLRLIDGQNVEWKTRAHFFGLAAQIMRTSWWISRALTLVGCWRSILFSGKQARTTS